MNDQLKTYCASAALVREKWFQPNPQISLRLLEFKAAKEVGNPVVVFIPGWVSLPEGWKIVLREMTKDFDVYYLETREKVTAKIMGKQGFSVPDIANDIAALVKHLKLENKAYILFGSSLGATAILEAVAQLGTTPMALILIGPNAVFRVPKWGMVLIYLFYPGFFSILKPFIKWYLKHFRLDVKSDPAQYEKYCCAINTADPWRLKRAVIPLSRYQIWECLNHIEIPTLIIGGSKDVLHEPDNLLKITEELKQSTYLDLETNYMTHSATMVQEVRKYLSTLKSG
ncbi:MAG: alpha/beta fold hydrolase [Fidelibacterota bacterium]